MKTTFKSRFEHANRVRELIGGTMTRFEAGDLILLDRKGRENDPLFNTEYANEVGVFPRDIGKLMKVSLNFPKELRDDRVSWNTYYYAIDLTDPKKGILALLASPGNDRVSLDMARDIWATTKKPGIGHPNKPVFYGPMKGVAAHAVRIINPGFAEAIVSKGTAKDIPAVTEVIDGLTTVLELLKEARKGLKKNS